MDRHKCFISFKTEDEWYKRQIQEKLGDFYIDKSLNEPIDSNDEDYVMRVIREDYLSDSTVTIVLIGTHSAEIFGEDEQYYIKRELQASLFNGQDNKRNGVLGVVLPNMYDRVFKGGFQCSKCGKQHQYVAINDNTVIKEFSYNYYLPNPKSGCAWDESDRYCVLVRYDAFMENPDVWIHVAFNKRDDTELNRKVRVRP